MKDGIQTTSRDLVFDVSGFVVTLLCFLMALGLVECANRIFGLVQIMDGAFGRFTGLLYFFAVVAVASIVISATKRFFGAPLAQLQSLSSRSLKVSQRTQNGYLRILEKFGYAKNIKHSSWFSTLFATPIYIFVGIVVLQNTRIPDANERLFQMVFILWIGVFFMVTLFVIVGSFVAGRLAQHRRNAPHKS